MFRLRLFPKRYDRFAGRLFGALFFAGNFAIAAFFFVQGVQRLHGFRSHEWSRTTAVPHTVSMERFKPVGHPEIGRPHKSISRTSYFPKVTFRYEVEGTSYTRVFDVLPAYTDQSAAEKAVNELRQGPGLSVVYRRSDPSDAYAGQLPRGRTVAVTLVSALGMILVGGIAINAFRVHRPLRSRKRQN